MLINWCISILSYGFASREVSRVYTPSSSGFTLTTALAISVAMAGLHEFPCKLMQVNARPNHVPFRFDPRATLANLLNIFFLLFFC